MSWHPTGGLPTWAGMGGGGPGAQGNGQENGRQPWHPSEANHADDEAGTTIDGSVGGAPVMSAPAEGAAAGGAGLGELADVAALAL